MVLGMPTLPWWQLAGIVLAALVAGLGALYSTSVRTCVPHLQDVDIGSLPDGWFLFPARAPCFIEGEQELLWVPGLDLQTGDVVSQRRRLKVTADGSYEFPSDGKQERGAKQSARSRELAKKIQHRKVKCYASQRDAFFDGFLGNPIQGESISRLVDSLPIGEALVTDILVMIVSSRVQQNKLEQSLHQLIPLLKDSALALRLQGFANSFMTAGCWADSIQSPKALIEGLAVNAAQLKELCRLEAGDSPGPFSAQELRDALTASGIDLTRARESLQELSWKAKTSNEHRTKDWIIMSGFKKQEQVQKVQAMLAIVSLAGIITWTVHRVWLD